MILTPNKDKSKLLEELEIFEKYINGDINNLNELHSSCQNSHFKEIETKILNIASQLENKNKASLTVYGEIMLACEKLSDGFTNDKITTVSHDPKLNYIAKTLNDMFGKLQNTIAEVMARLNEYKNLNYMNSIDDSVFRGGEFKSLLQGVNSLKDEITENLKNSHRDSMVLEHEAQTLKDKAMLLSQSSQKQSVAIEETAAAVVQISSNINSNMRSAQDMLSFGTEVKNSTTKGSELANDTFESMEDISQSTNKVYEAISVISQIAFQTNILSLNAAVEAATAGEAGKGFAVVAQEVRNLASRSDEAAKEIGNLMDELQLKSNKGKNIANDMKDDYENLTHNITKTVELIDTIVVSSKEQSIGIIQVEDALNSIDAEVQKNSAVSDDVSTVSNQVYNVTKKMLEISNKAQFVGKDKLSIRENTLLRKEKEASINTRR